MESAGGEVLKKPSDEGQSAGTGSEEGQGNQAEGQHGRRTGCSDIPLEFPAPQRLSGTVGNLQRPQVVSAQLAVAKGTAGTNDLKVLGPQSRFFPFGPNLNHMQRLTQEGRQRDRVAKKGSASRMRRAVNFDHGFRSERFFLRIRKESRWSRRFSKGVSSPHRRTERKASQSPQQPFPSWLSPLTASPKKESGQAECSYRIRLRSANGFDAMILFKPNGRPPVSDGERQQIFTFPLYINLY